MGKNTEKVKKPIFKKWWFWVIIACIVIGGVSGRASKDNASDKTTDTTLSSSVDPEDTGTDGAEADTVPEETVDQPEESTDTPVAEESKADDVPTEYLSALIKAQTYSDMMAMSKAGIYDQLTSQFEQFSAEAANYAIENVEADWNANALAKAEQYSETMYMSKAGIYDQLVSDMGERFTAEEAQYAIDNIEADWNANALAKAKTYQDTMAMSPAAIYDQLVSEYGEKFTAEEAQYAIDNLS